jgi:hypothetical protein
VGQSEPRTAGPSACWRVIDHTTIHITTKSVVSLRLAPGTNILFRLYEDGTRRDTTLTRGGGWRALVVQALSGFFHRRTARSFTADDATNLESGLHSSDLIRSPAADAFIPHQHAYVPYMVCVCVSCVCGHVKETDHSGHEARSRWGCRRRQRRNGAGPRRR